jgi:hypothetical protein
LKELAFTRMIERGLSDSRAGRTISNEEMKQRNGETREEHMGMGRDELENEIMKRCCSPKTPAGILE